MWIKLNEKHPRLTQHFYNSVLSLIQSALWKFGHTNTPPKLKAQLKTLYIAGINTSLLPKSNVTDAKLLWKSNELYR